MCQLKNSKSTRRRQGRKCWKAGALARLRTPRSLLAKRLVPPTPPPPLEPQHSRTLQEFRGVLKFRRTLSHPTSFHRGPVGTFSNDLLDPNIAGHRPLPKEDQRVAHRGCLGIVDRTERGVAKPYAGHLTVCSFFWHRCMATSTCCSTRRPWSPALWPVTRTPKPDGRC